MTTKDYEDVFGAVHSTRASFTQRIRPDAAKANGHAPEEATGSGPYKPYGFLPSGTIGETCEVTRWIDGTEIPEGLDFPYRLLMQVGFVGEEQLRLFLPDCIVLVEGKHLNDLRKKLGRRQATFIRQYNRCVWPKPPPAGEPLIDKITVIRPDPHD